MRDEFLKLMNHEEPSHFMQPWDSRMVFTPGEHGNGEITDEKGRQIGKDWFGCTWVHIGNGPVDGDTLLTGSEPFEDMEELMDADIIPTYDDIAAFDWESHSKMMLEGFDRENQVLLVRSLIGFFERMHCLIGFENALCAFYEEPELVHEFFEKMLEYKKTVVDFTVEYMKPDVMIFDDDYGTMKSTFMDPDMWREFFPKYWKELIDYVHSKGVKVELHSCGYVTPLVEDFVELGFDILQPVQTHNDLKKMKEAAQDKMVLRMAIFDKQMSALNQTEDEIRADIRSYYETLAPGGSFIPDLVPIADRYYEIQREVQDEYEAELYGFCSNVPRA